jgi:hypothetical protein
MINIIYHSFSVKGKSDQFEVNAEPTLGNNFLSKPIHVLHVQKHVA